MLLSDKKSSANVNALYLEKNLFQNPKLDFHSLKNVFSNAGFQKINKIESHIIKAVIFGIEN